MDPEKVVAETVGSMFEEMFQSLTIEHAIKETDFKHLFNSNKVVNAKTSPYMQVKDENDSIMTGKDAQKLPDGSA